MGGRRGHQLEAGDASRQIPGQGIQYKGMGMDVRARSKAARKIWDTADKHKISLRTATYAVACERILMAREERGLYP